MAQEINKLELLRQLDKIHPPDSGDATENLLRKISLTAALPALTEIDQEREFQLCQMVARHLLGQVPEPPDSDLD